MNIPNSGFGSNIKKAKAVTATGSTNAPSKKFSKPVNEMSSQEYLEYVQSQGMKIK